MNVLENEIGEAAGKVWQALHESKSMSKTEIANETDLSSVLVNQGIGWLAREGKLIRGKEKRVEKFRICD